VRLFDCVPCKPKDLYIEINKKLGYGKYEDYLYGDHEFHVISDGLITATRIRGSNVVHPQKIDDVLVNNIETAYSKRGPVVDFSIYNRENNHQWHNFNDKKAISEISKIGCHAIYLNRNHKRYYMVLFISENLEKTLFIPKSWKVELQAEMAHSDFLQNNKVIYKESYSTDFSNTRYDYLCSFLTEERRQNVEKIGLRVDGDINFFVERIRSNHRSSSFSRGISIFIKLAKKYGFNQYRFVDEAFRIQHYASMRAGKEIVLDLHAEVFDGRSKERLQNFCTEFSIACVKADIPPGPVPMLNLKSVKDDLEGKNGLLNLFVQLENLIHQINGNLPKLETDRTLWTKLQLIDLWKSEKSKLEENLQAGGDLNQAFEALKVIKLGLIDELKQSAEDKLPLLLKVKKKLQIIKNVRKLFGEHRPRETWIKSRSTAFPYVFFRDTSGPITLGRKWSEQVLEKLVVVDPGLRDQLTAMGQSRREHPLESKVKDTLSPNVLQELSEEVISDNEAGTSTFGSDKDTTSFNSDVADDIIETITVHEDHSSENDESESQLDEGLVL